MKRKFNKAAVIKRVADMESGIKSKKNPDLLRVARMEAGDLYEGVTDNVEVSDTASYRMITRADQTVNTQGS